MYASILPPIALVLLAACAAPPAGHHRGPGPGPEPVPTPVPTESEPVCLRVEVETVWTYEGSVSTREVTVHDPEGRVVHDESDVFPSDDPWDHETSDWTYDEHGRPANRKVYQYGVLDRTERWESTYDDDGREVEEAYRWRGRPVWERKRWTWDDLGQRVEESVDRNDDGTIDEITTWTWVDGRVATEENGSLPPTWRLRWIYDALGRVDTIETDEGDDGDVDERTTFTYDGQGNVSLERRDDDADGRIDSRTRFLNTYDSSDRLTERAVDMHDDGVVDYASTFTWDGYEVATETFFTGPDFEHASTATTTRTEEPCPGP